MNIQSKKRLANLPIMFQVLCLLAASTLAGAITSCTTKNCKDLEAIIKGNMDPKVDPCQDFYQYACGNFIKRNPVPPGLAKYNTQTPFAIRLDEKLYRLLGEPESPKDGKGVNAIKRQYKICQNEDKLDADGLTALLKVIKDNGGWPMIVPGQFRPTKSVQEVQDEYNRKTGRGPLYTVLVLTSAPTSTDHAITLDQPLEFPKFHYNISDPVKGEKFVKYIADVAAEFAKASGVSIPKDKLNKDAKDVFDFTVKIAKLRNPDEWRKRGSHMKVSEAQAAITNGTPSSFDLLGALQRTYQKLPAVKLTKDEGINVRELEYLQGLIKLLKDTDPVVALNYVHFHFIENYVPLTTRAARNLAQNVYEGEPLNRTVSCAKLPNVGRALGRLFVKKYIPASAVTAVKKIVEDVKAQIRVQVERTAFIDAKTRPEALAKLDNLVTFVGYDDSLSSDEKVESYYSQFQISENLVENLLNYNEVEYKTYLEKLRHPVVLQEAREKSYTDATDPGASYEVMYNRLKIFGGVIDEPLFAEDYPPMSNYAGLGHIIAGLLSDMYSLAGPSFDDKGLPRHWASKPVEAEFEKRDRCFVEQYSNATIKELDDAKISYDMNELAYFPVTASSHFGLKTVYHAHKLHSSSQKNVQGLALDASIDKQFFLNFATNLCETVNPSYLLKVLLEAPLTTSNRIKVNSAVSNLPEFSAAYGCAPNTPMNPSKKCTVLD